MFSLVGWTWGPLSKLLLAFKPKRLRLMKLGTTDDSLGKDSLGGFDYGDGGDFDEADIQTGKSGGGKLYDQFSAASVDTGPLGPQCASLMAIVNKTTVPFGPYKGTLKGCA